MAGSSEEFLRRLRETFQEEAREHLQEVSAGLIALEGQPPPGERDALLERIFRGMHSLKGASRAVSRRDIESACQRIEAIFAAARRAPDTIAWPKETFDTLHKAVSLIGILMEQEGAKAEETKAELGKALSSMKCREAALEQSPPPPRKTGDAPAVADGEAVHAQAAATTRIPTARIESLLRNAEQLFFIKQILAADLPLLRGFTEAMEAWDREWKQTASSRGIVRRALERGSNGDGARTRRAQGSLLDFIERTHERMRALERELRAALEAAERRIPLACERMDGLLEETKHLLMLPCSSLLDPFPSIARELARSLGKEAGLEIAGGDIEIDKRILDELRDPLIHLVRNSIDHGIERPEERTRAGKTTQGKIELISSRLPDGRIEILIADDGAGIDSNAVRDAAVLCGIIDRDSASDMDDAVSLQLVFRSGVSTRPDPGTISGRGLGLSIAREKVESLGGTIDVSTVPGKGTTFRIQLPATIASIRGVLVRCGEHRFLLPSRRIAQTIRVRKADIASVEGRPTVAVGGRYASLVPLASLLAASCPSPLDRDTFPAVVLEPSDGLLALAVDEIAGEQEVLAKPLGIRLPALRLYAGAAVLGFGQVTPILDPTSLAEAARSTRPADTAVAAQVERPTRRSILVVEDSITSRMLLKNILESVGYQVQTAADGLDALTLLKTAGFDLVVSDIDMPRMNGFVLTEKIRSDSRLKDLPVILVTALESREDRERGVDAGANAYLIKSSFEQGTLLEIVRRYL